MQTTTYTCDRCGKQSNDKSVLNGERVGVHLGYNNYYGNPAKVSYDQDWCRECLLRTGLLKPDPNKSEPEVVVEPITLEDLVREIVRQEIQG